MDATIAVTQGICLRWMPLRRTWSIAVAELDFPKIRCACAARSRDPPNCRRVRWVITLLEYHRHTQRWNMIYNRPVKKLCFSLSFAMAFAQAQQAPITRSLSHAIHAVDDLDTTLAFYRSVFGINGNPSD